MNAPALYLPRVDPVTHDEMTDALDDLVAASLNALEAARRFRPQHEIAALEAIFVSASDLLGAHVGGAAE